jgi:histidinol-phosphate aminotransferase
VIETLQANSNLVNLYPEDYPKDLIDAISKYVDLPTDMIIPGGNGADEIMDIMIKLLVSEGDEVVIHTPTFPYYELLVNLYGGSVVNVPMKEDFNFPVDDILESLSGKTKLVIICSPNNPTGTTISKDEIRRMLQKAPLVMLDEAYVEFTDTSMSNLVREHENLIVLRTFSKAFALAGLRVGYGIAQPELIREALKIKPPHSVNILAQKAAVAALEDQDYMKSSVLEIKRLKEDLFNKLSKFEEVIIYPSEANFLLMTLKTGDAKSIIHHLEKKGVIVRGCKGFGLPNSIRVTIGTEQENTEFLRALKDVLK